eukprot:2667653-Prymnesium_polylepis.1
MSAAALRARAAAQALKCVEFCRLLGGGDWDAGLQQLLREELAAATVQLQPRHGDDCARQHQGPGAGP